MEKPIKLLVFAKTLDGGIGTFLTKFLKIEKEFPKDKIVIKNVILEKPRYFDIKKNKKNFIFLKTRDYSLQKYNFSIKNILSIIEEIFWFKNEVEKFNPAIIFSIDINCNLIAGIVRTIFFKKFKTIFTTHIDLKGTLTQKSTPFLRFILKKVITLFYNRTDFLICISKNLAKSLKKDFNLNKKVIIIYYGGFYKKTNKNNPLKKKKNIILTVARLDEAKDHVTLIKAFKLVNSELPASKLLVIGEGMLKNRLKELVKSLKLQKNVIFLGWKKNVFPYLRKSDIFVLSSKREGFSFALLEAISQGKPVVSTNTPYGPSEILGSGKYGILVPMKDEIALKKAVVELLTNSNKYKYYASKALERSKFFSDKKMLKSYKKIIINLYKDI